MIDRVEAQFDIKPERLIGDTAYGSAPMLAWMVEEKDIEPHMPAWDKTERRNNSFSSNDFHWNEEAEEYRCPAGNVLRSEWRAFKNDRLRDMSDENQVLPEHCVPQDRPQRPLSRARCGSANRSDTCVLALSPRT